MSLSTEELGLIAAAREVTIETRSGDRVIGTVIWVVVVDEDIYVRSVDGEAGHWYRRALAEPEVALRVGDARFRFRAVPASDADSVERASEGLRLKYRGRSLEMMLLPEVLGTTLLLQPR